MFLLAVWVISLRDFPISIWLIEIFRMMLLICSFQDSLLSIVIPKNFVCATTGKDSESIFIIGFMLVSSDVLGRNIIAMLFCVLRDNLLALNHESRFLISS